jgi:hypothetical protein
MKALLALLQEWFRARFDEFSLVQRTKRTVLGEQPNVFECLECRIQTTNMFLCDDCVAKNYFGDKDKPQ